jgi:hypothetical protein
MIFFEKWGLSNTKDEDAKPAPFVHDPYDENLKKYGEFTDDEVDHANVEVSLERRGQNTDDLLSGEESERERKERNKNYDANRGAEERGKR